MLPFSGSAVLRKRSLLTFFIHNTSLTATAIINDLVYQKTSSLPTPRCRGANPIYRKPLQRSEVCRSLIALASITTRKLIQLHCLQTERRLPRVYTFEVS